MFLLFFLLVLINITLKNLMQLNESSSSSNEYGYNLGEIYQPEGLLTTAQKLAKLYDINR